MNTKVGIAFIAGVLAAVVVFYATSRRSEAVRENPATPTVAQIAAVEPAVGPSAVQAPAPDPPVANPTPPVLVSVPPAPKPRRAKIVPPPQEPDPEPVRVPDPEGAAAPTRPAEPVVRVPEQVVEVPTPVELPPPSPPRVKARPAPEPRQPGTVTLAPGTELQIRLGEPLSSERNRAGDTFVGTLEEALVADGFVIAERGARVEGRIAEAADAGRVKGLARLVLELTHIYTSDHQRVEIRTERYERLGDRAVKEDLGKIAVGAAIGATIGATAGGGKAAAIGAAAGAAAGAGAVVLTKGPPARFGAEARITFRLDQPVTITEQL